jgi:putative membrane protein
MNGGSRANCAAEAQTASAWARWRSAWVAWSYPLWLLAAFAVIFVALGAAPYDRGVWALENLLIAIALSLFIATRRILRFSDLSYTLLFLFFIVHEIGAHYTYARVPYAEWIARLTGGSVNLLRAGERNDYDRVIHFSYGLLVLLPAVELLRYAAPPRGVWQWLLPPFFILSHAALYEQIEWAATLVFGSEVGSTYLGAQGDVWDSEKDVLMAVLGSLLALAIMAVAEAVRRRRQRASG